MQIGKPPPELTGLTLPEKILIAVYRAKMYISTFRSFLGPGTGQRGIKGNTITFPQDIVQISKKLPGKTDCLSDNIKVIFIGRTVPSKEAMKKVLTVRREKVYAALNFLHTHHPLYKDVDIDNTVDLPDDDIPGEIWKISCHHEDENNEDEKEHATYVPQPTSDSVSTDVLMESSGVLDLGGDEVSTSSQLTAALQNLQGTMIVPHGQNPLTDYNNPLLWLGSYPWLFPYGLGGPEAPRKTSLSLRMYIRHLLLYAEDHFKLDIAFKFHVFNVLQKRSVSLHTSLLLKSPQSSYIKDNISNLNHSTLIKLLEAVEKKVSPVDPRIKVLLDNLSSTGAKIDGSPYCKKGSRREIFGLMTQFGMASYFVTVSPTSIHSPIVSFLAGKEIDIDNLNISELPSTYERAKLAADDPVSVAQFFNITIDAFTAYLLGYHQHNGGILGKVAAFYGCIEEEGSGTLHIHMLVWLDGFSSRNQIEEGLANEEFKADLLAYLENTIHEGYFGGDINFDHSSLEASTVSYRRPVPPENFGRDLVEDVNSLVAVANTHRHTHTCYKYGKSKECRFGFPRPLVEESSVDNDEILIRRTSPIINNYNPYFMTCLRCNHDLKFIPSGRDGRSCAFYMTNYTTKDSLSSHQVFPLMASSMKQVDLQSDMLDAQRRSKMMLTKMLNRITTETELSASHVCHFLLGNKDNKTSHTFSQLNLHVALSWIIGEEKVYDGVLEEEEEENYEEEDNQGFFIEKGNSGLVLVNAFSDYRFRGQALKDISYYEYVSSIFKTKLNESESKKFKDYQSGLKKPGRDLQPRYSFEEGHPQSETHIQKVKATQVVPSLSFFPPSENYNSEKFYKCMLLLFKPFTCFGDLYNGISWEDSYTSADFGHNASYIDNIQEMHKGIDEKKQSVDQDDDGLVAEDSSSEQIIADEYDSAENNLRSLREDFEDNVFDHISGCVPSITTENEPVSVSHSSSQFLLWKKEIKDQLSNRELQLCFGDDGNENVPPEHGAYWEEESSRKNDDDIHFDIAPVLVDIDPSKIIQALKEKYSLNPKQAEVFRLVTQNTVKRLKGEPVTQIIAYIGGEGGTGKSQVIKAMVDFFEQVNSRHEIRLAAYTGTAAKHIGGKTLASLAKLRGGKVSSKLEKTWKSVTTTVVDEVSMNGCRLLAKLSRNITRAKHNSPDIPFGGRHVFLR